MDKQDDSAEPENRPQNRQRLHPAMESRKFKPGQTGNAGGRPEEKPITETYEKILRDPKNLALLEKIFCAGYSPRRRDPIQGKWLEPH